MTPTEKQLQQLKERIELAFAGYKAGSWEWNLQTDEAFYSKEWFRLLGYKSHDKIADITLWSSLVHPDDLERVMEDVADALAKKAFSVEAIHRLKAADGSWLWILGRGAIEYDADNRPLRMVGIHSDITRQKEQELKIKQQAQIIEQVPDAIILVSLDGKILSWNRGATSMLQYRAGEVLDKDIKLVLTNDAKEQFLRYMQEIIKNSEENPNIHSEITFLQKDGNEIDVGVSFSLLKDAEASLSAVVIYGQDITQRVATYKKLVLQKERLNRQAHHDILTGLPNRVYFQKKLHECINHLQEGKSLALFFVDLDNFKYVNDTYGHGMGDKVLQETAKRLRKSIRKTDFIARLSGDEFTIILQDLKSINDVKHVAQNILNTLKKVFTIDKQHEVHLGCSIGIAIYPDDAKSSKELLACADKAMYAAKSSGKNTFKLYSLMI
jgi:diguanylate cyclase (GGDEF)-like protein/PAS domain S-box-containing protein